MPKKLHKYFSRSEFSCDSQIFGFIAKTVHPDLLEVCIERCTIFQYQIFVMIAVAMAR